MKTQIMLALLALVAIAVPSANAAEILIDGGFRLDPFRAYTVGITLDPQGAPITEFELVFEGVRPSSALVGTAGVGGQYRAAPLTGLSVRLLDLDLNGSAWVEERQRQVSGGFLQGQSVGNSLVFKFDSALLDLLNQGQVGSWAMTLTTSSSLEFESASYGSGVTQALIVPAPGAVFLVGIGTMSVGWLRRRNTV